MNKTYRLIWNEITHTWVPVSENTKCRGKRASGAVILAAVGVALIAQSPAFAAPPNPPSATQLPNGGQVVAGSANINQNAAVMDIIQSSNRAAIDWQSFDVGSQAQVNFNQPSSSSVTLNRVLDSNPSQIFGRVTANGQVFLTNPSGVYFAPGASVDVGGLVATTHAISNDDFMAGNDRFTRDGATGSVINEGDLTATLGGYIALLAPEVRNNGIVIAEMGTVALAAGEAFELQFEGNNTLANLRVEASTIQALVDNGNAVRAPGGLIILSAQAVNNLQGGGIINNSGTLEASGLVNNGGRIILDASGIISHTGEIHADAAPNSSGNGGTVTLIANLANADSRADINGTISARGGDLGGDGGFVETSGGRVTIGDSTRVDTQAPNGKTGTWLIDPDGFTIAASGGDISGTTLSTNLGSSDVSILSVNGSGSDGNVNVNDVVSWSLNKLTLNVTNNINVNANMNASGSASLALEYGQGAIAAGNTSKVTTTGASVNLPASTSNFTTKQGSDGVVKNYTVITSLGAQGSTTGMDLQGVNGGLGINYALGGNIDASAAAAWNAGAGFTSLGNASTKFTGTFDGLGHTISDLTVATSNLAGGLFGVVSNATIQNLNLDRVTISALPAGALAGSVTGSTIRNVTANDVSVKHLGGNAWGEKGGLIGTATNSTLSYLAVTGTSAMNEGVGGWLTGGLVGHLSSSTLDYGSSTAAVFAGGYDVGGLVGRSSSSTVSNSTATGNVTSSYDRVGGLIGRQYGNSTILNSSATGNVSGRREVGGLLGGGNSGSGSISGSFATGTVTGSGDKAGGLAGYFVGTISDSYASGNVSGTTNVGGLVGWNAGAISGSHSDASDVTGTTNVGGLVGNNDTAGSITGSHVIGTSTVTSSGDNAGGLVGQNLGSVTTSTVSSGSTVTGAKNVGGLVGVNGGFTNITASITSSTSAAAVNLPDSRTLAGGLVGRNFGAITNSYSSGLVTAGINTLGLGGLTGISSGTISNDASNTASVIAGAGADAVGTLIGILSGTENGSASTGTVTIDGTVTSPRIGLSYTDGLISTAGQLNYIQYFQNKNFSLANDLDLTGITFTPITYGLGAAPGSGILIPVFDGMGYTISNLTVSASNLAGGLFGSVSYATIQNLNLDNVSISALPAGALAGSVSYSTISNVTANNVSVKHLGSNAWGEKGGLIGTATNSTLSYLAVTGTSAMNEGVGGWLTGGLVGHLNSSTLDYGSSTAAVFAGGYDVGGLVGRSSSSAVSNSTATGNVTSTYDRVGGLIGRQYGNSAVVNSSATGNVSGRREVGGLLGGGNSAGGSISGSFATGTVTGSVSGDKAGGLAGYFAGTISNSYASGNVSGNTNVGGLVGSNTGTVRQSYSIGSVSGTSGIGGLVGVNTGTVTDSFWNTETSGQASSAGGTGKTTAEMKTRSTYPSSWDFTTPNAEVWNIDPSINGGYPYLCGIVGGCGTTTIYLRLSPGGSIYGDLPDFTYGYYMDATTGALVTDAAPTGTVTWSGAPNSTSNVGTYSLTYSSGITLGNSSYELAAGDAIDWFVTARQLNLTVGKFYDGSSSFSSGFVVSGTVNGDATPTISGSVSTSSANAGNYTSFSSSTLALNNANYTFSGGTLAASVTPRSITVSTADKSRTYGNADPALTWSVTSGSLVGSDTLGGALSRSVGENTGSYAIDASTLTNGNYQITANNGVLMITPRAITVAAADKGKAYGNADPALTWNLSSGNLVGSDTLSGALTRSAGEKIGSYTINASALANGNYIITAHNGTLSISLAPLAESTTAPPPPQTIIPPVQLAMNDTTPSLQGGLGETVSTDAVNDIFSVDESTNAVSSDNDVVSADEASTDPQRSLEADASGTIAVSVSSLVGNIGNGFSFMLSDRQINELSASGTPVQATTLNGDQLPAWLTFDPDRLTFVANTVPEKTFPIKLLVTNGEKQFKIIITKGNSK